MSTKTKIDTPTAVRKRHERGEMFNAYRVRSNGSWLVAIGPITDFIEIARVHSAAKANLLVDSLRLTFDQPAQLVRAEDHD